MTEHPHPARPGWYPTPEGQQRFWDGVQWTPSVVPAGPATRAQDEAPSHRHHEVQGVAGTLIGGALLAVEVVVAVLSLFIAFVWTSTYGDLNATTSDVLTSGFVWFPLLLIVPAGLGAVFALPRWWMGVMALAIPVLMVVGMLMVFPAALASKVEGSVPVGYEGMRHAGEDVAQARRGDGQGTSPLIRWTTQRAPLSRDAHNAPKSRR